jgi:formamidopyrimidine-DNA glycosylase
MPELAEIEVLKSEIEGSLLRKRITDLHLEDPKVINLPFERFKEGIVGADLVSVERRGKMLGFSLSNKKSILIHLMLFGRCLLKESGGGQVGLEFDGSEWLIFTHLIFSAGLSLYNTDIDKIPQVARLGRDALKIEFYELKRLLEKSRRRIKPVLMDQSAIAGIGNRYSDEILFEAKISPQRRADSLTEAEIKTLHIQIRKILECAILKGGEDSSEFFHIDGRRGGFVPKVHGKEFCPICAERLGMTKIGGRTAYYCLRCQV